MFSAISLVVEDSCEVRLERIVQSPEKIEVTSPATNDACAEQMRTDAKLWFNWCFTLNSCFIRQTPAVLSAER